MTPEPTGRQNECPHDWRDGPTMDMEPPIESRRCDHCGLWQSRQDPPFGDGVWHPAAGREESQS